MKIALIHEFLNQFGGAERVLLALHETFPEAPIYTLLMDKTKLPEQFCNLDIRTSNLQRMPNFIKKRHKLLLCFYPFAAEQIDLSKYNLVISDSNSFAKGVLTGPETKHICYCHTPTGYLWHYNQEYLKEQELSNISKMVVSRMLNKLRIWDYNAAQRVDYFIANSKNVQRRIKKYYNRDSEIIYPPVDVNQFKVSKQSDNFFLIVSRLSAYKKIDLAIRAFNNLPNERLKIIGNGPKFHTLKNIARQNVEFLGFQSDKMIKEYYQKCLALIFPAEEDFGITPVEAMACGKPVIAYKKGGALETLLEGKTAIFFEKPTSESLKEAILKFIKMSDKFDAQEIRKQAEKFDKRIFQNKIRNFIRKLKGG